MKTCLFMAQDKNLLSTGFSTEVKDHLYFCILHTPFFLEQYTCLSAYVCFNRENVIFYQIILIQFSRGLQ